MVARHPASTSRSTAATSGTASTWRSRSPSPALPLARRAPALAALAAVPYLSARLNWREPHPRRLARALATMPLFATFDAIEVAARLPAAVRHRVAVL